MLGLPPTTEYGGKSLVRTQFAAIILLISSYNYITSVEIKLKGHIT